MRRGCPAVQRSREGCLGELVDKRVKAEKLVGIAAPVALEQVVLQGPAGRTHPDEGGTGATHQAVAQEAVLAGDEQLVGKALEDQAGDVLERHDAVQCCDLDADNLGTGQQLAQNRCAVIEPSGRLVEMEEDQRKPRPGDFFMVPNDQAIAVGTVAGEARRMNQEGVGAELGGLVGHQPGRRQRPIDIHRLRGCAGRGDQEPATRQGRLPVGQDRGPLFGIELQSAAGMRPDRDPPNRMARQS